MAKLTHNVTITAKDKASGAFKAVGSSSKGLQENIFQLTSIASNLINITGSLVNAFKGVTSAMGKVVEISNEQIKVEAQLNAVIKSTGQAAGLTAEEIKDMAAGFQEVTTFGDEAVITAQNILLTFKQIGGDDGIFERTTAVVLDVATAMGMDAKSASLQLGKALNDPATGLSMLTRVGITFSEAQKDIIKGFQEQGDIASAQKEILKELESQFEGSARAMRDTFGGAMQGLKNAWGDLLEDLGQFITKNAALKELLNDLEQVVKNVAGEILGYAKAAEGGTKAADLLRATIAGVLDGFASMLTAIFEMNFSLEGLISTIQGVVDVSIRLTKHIATGFMFVISDLIGLIGDTVEETFELSEAQNTVVESIRKNAKALRENSIELKTSKDNIAEVTVTLSAQEKALMSGMSAWLSWADSQKHLKIAKVSWEELSDIVGGADERLSLWNMNFQNYLQGYAKLGGALGKFIPQFKEVSESASADFQTPDMPWLDNVQQEAEVAKSRNASERAALKVLQERLGLQDTYNERITEAEILGHGETIARTKAGKIARDNVGIIKETVDVLKEAGSTEEAIGDLLKEAGLEQEKLNQLKDKGLSDEIEGMTKLQKASEEAAETEKKALKEKVDLQKEAIKDITDAQEESLNHLRIVNELTSKAVGDSWRAAAAEIKKASDWQLFFLNILGIKISDYDPSFSQSGLPAFAEGGTVYGPTMLLAGEDGRETIIPETKPDRARDLLMDLFHRNPNLINSASGGSASVAAQSAPVSITVNTMEGDGNEIANILASRMDEILGRRVN